MKTYLSIPGFSLKDVNKRKDLNFAREAYTTYMLSVFKLVFRNVYLPNDSATDLQGTTSYVNSWLSYLICTDMNGNKNGECLPLTV